LRESGPKERPYRAQVNWVDYSTAAHAALGVMIALFQRATTGQGQEISASLLETAVSYENPILIDQIALNSNRGGLGNRGYNTGPTDVYKVKDGWIVCHVVGNGIFRRWARLMGDEPRWEDERFSTDLLRGQNGA
jgi:crotonobetainyl-CoA:carnitine CoA-transferase CaiB-like acyl-CoA transferase